MESKAKKYVADLGKSVSDLPKKYQENFEVMSEFAEIMALVGEGTSEYDEAKDEWEDYDKLILQALKRDYPSDKPKAGKKVATKPKKEPQTKPAESFDSMPPVNEKGERRIDKAALDALESYLNGLPQTKKMHSEQGEYTQERQKLHKQVIDKEVSDNECIRRDAPIAILTGGLPGSGKSTYIRKNKDWMTNPAIFKIDADEIRAKLPEYKGWNATQTHSETQDMVRSLLNKVGKTGCSYDVIYDGTMNKSKKYKPLIDTLKKEGYRVFILFMQVDKATSMSRAMGRYQRSGRYVPRFVIEEGAQNGLSAFNELKGMVDGYVLVDGETQKIIEKGGADLPDDRDYTKLSTPASAKKVSTPKKTKSGSTGKKPAYSWNKPSDTRELKPVVLHCQHYHLPVKEDTVVSLKGTGKQSRRVTAKSGEHLIFDDQGHLVFIMDASSYKEKCTEKSTVKEHKAEKHKSSASGKSATRRPSATETAKVKRSRSRSKPKKKKPSKASKPQKAQERRSPIEVVTRELMQIRKQQNKGQIDRDALKKEIEDLHERKNMKSYVKYIRRQLKAAKNDEITLTKDQVIKIGRMVHPMLKTVAGQMGDILRAHNRIVKPNLDGLLRWANNPAMYDLPGVDIDEKAKPTVNARRPKEPKLFRLLNL